MTKRMNQAVAKLWRRVAPGFGETGIAAILVVACFAAMIGLLGLVFPSGANLRDLVGQAADRSAGEVGSAGGRARDLYVEGDAGDPTIGRIENTRRTVKARAAEAISWDAARPGRILRDRDAVQTLKNSSAVIGLGGAQQLELGQNTLVVLKRPDRRLLSAEKRSYLLMVDGELRGRLVGDPRQAIQLEVETPSGWARFRAGDDAGKEVAFKVQVAPDSSSTVTVEKGRAEVRTGEQSVVVRAGEFTRLTREAPPAQPQSLAPGPAAQSPEPGVVIPYREVAPPVEFRWAPLPAADAYRFVLSKDAERRDVLLDQEVEEPRLVHAGLRSGEYHWTVIGLRRGVEFTRPATAELQTRQDRDAPVLDVEFPEGPVHADAVVLQGRTEPSSRLVIGGEDVVVSPQGTFAHTVRLKPGLNVVVIESYDRFGNVTYQSRMISRKYSPDAAGEE